MVLEEKHKLATRWFHWVNFPLLGAMIFSGLLIYWAYDPYRIGLGGTTLFHFFPDWFYDLAGIGQQLALGMALHFFFAWLFAINGIAYVLYTLISGEWRVLVPDRNSFREALQVAMHDAGFKVPLPPQGRYNAAQRITYSAIVIMGGGLSLVTGLSIYKPARTALAHDGAGRISMGALRAFLADDRLRWLFRDPHRPGDPRGVGELSRDGLRIRSGYKGGTG